MGGPEKKIGSAAAGLRLLSLLAAFAPAFAGAWIAPKEGQLITTFAGGERDGFGVLEASNYWEQPLAPRTSFVLAPWSEGLTGGEQTWRGEVTLGLKQALVRTDHTAMAVQASAAWRSDPDRHCDEGGVEVRWLGGVSAGRRFLNVEAAERGGAGGCTEQRFDVTAGYHAGEHWLGLAEVFTDAPSWGETALKAQLSLVRLGDADKGIQVGVRTRIDNGPPETELVLGFWGRPRR